MIVFATLFVCGGVYPITLLSAWCDAFAAERTTVLVVGGCDVHCCETSVIRRINNSVPTVGGGDKRYEHLHNKFELWGLPATKVVYYDIDIDIKKPVGHCASLCTCFFCAVRDPVATWPRKVKGYFNGGFLVLSPNRTEYTALRTHYTVSGRRFAEQDVLNDHFAGRWCKLPRECNWLHYRENYPHARGDPKVWMVHGA